MIRTRTPSSDACICIHNRTRSCSTSRGSSGLTRLRASESTTPGRLPGGGFGRGPLLGPGRADLVAHAGQAAAGGQVELPAVPLVLVVPALGVLDALLGQALEERVDELVVLPDPRGREPARQEQRVDPVHLADV